MPPIRGQMLLYGRLSLRCVIPKLWWKGRWWRRPRGTGERVDRRSLKQSTFLRRLNSPPFLLVHVFQHLLHFPLFHFPLRPSRIAYSERTFSIRLALSFLQTFHLPCRNTLSLCTQLNRAFVVNVAPPLLYLTLSFPTWWMARYWPYFIRRLCDRLGFG